MSDTRAMRIFIKLAAVMLLFTGCTISEDGIDTANIDADVCEESGGEFCSPDDSVSSLELLIETNDPVISESSNGDCDGGRSNGSVDSLNYCFDISGLCNEAGLDLAHVVARHSLDGFTSSQTLGSCQKGKFHVQFKIGLSGVAGPNGFCRLHTLELELVGKKADGSEVTLPSKAKKRIGFIVRNNEAC